MSNRPEDADLEHILNVGTYKQWITLHATSQGLMGDRKQNHTDTFQG